MTDLEREARATVLSALASLAVRAEAAASENRAPEAEQLATAIASLGEAACSLAAAQAEVESRE